MKLKNLKLSVGAVPALALFALLPGAHASLIFNLTQDGCTGTCGTGPFGTITLTQDSATQISITETLAANERYAGSGAGDALEFNFTKPFTFGTLPTGFAIGPAPDSASVFGSFFQSVTCTACQGGQAGNPAGPLTFVITGSNILITDFAPNSGGYYFASDIVGNNGKTGNVAANSFVSTAPPPSVPEPVSVLLVGSALLGLGVFQSTRRNSRRSE